MKLKNCKTYAMALLVTMAFVFTNCSKKSGGNGTSQATGWKINDPRGGFKYNEKYKQQANPPGMVPIEGGTFTMGKIEDDVMHDWNNTPTQQHVQSFYMDETEVTNKMYSEYLYWLKSVFSPDDEKYKNIYAGALPDTLVWRNRLGYSETMVNNYLRHPAYGDYPVVGVNWVQASEFCVWRTDRVNEDILERERFIKRDAKTTAVNDQNTFSTDAYILSPSTVYGGNAAIVYRGQGGRTPKAPKAAPAAAGTSNANSNSGAKNVFATRGSGVILPEYRLPTEVEWEYAATSLEGLREYNIYRGKRKYPWSGQYTRNGKRQYRGDQLANFKQGKGDYGGVAGWSDDGADITQKVKKYPPNDYGLYDMAGNVAEWVADVYRPIIDDEANDFNYFRGSVFKKTKIGKDGKAELVTKENMSYDTLPNGKIVARNFPGQIAQVPIDDNETYLRQNFSKSDNRNFRDGDKESTRYFKSNKEEVAGGDDKRMYDSPKNTVTRDSLGNLVRKIDTKGRTSLVNEDVRVYKGGSWKDRAYWLNPGTRRYFPQDMATDYIGFRCAMSKVGPKTTAKKPRS